MALGSHELLLILRVRDEGTRMLNQFGRAFTDLDTASQKAARNQIAAGAAMTSAAVGIGSAVAAAAAFLQDATKEAKEFEQGVTLVGTQQDKLKNSTKELGDVIKNVAREVAVPLDTIDEGLFDIFSSMDVNLPQAERLLTQFSKAAVGGATDLQTAGRAAIAIMNAWHIPAEEVNRVLDVQFQLIRKGVGTYEEFASTIGRAIPSAQRAGQSVETLAGMLAYLTRNGLSAAMASASAGRAFDAFANPKTIGRLQDMGIRVTEANGSFRDLGGVIVDLQKKLADLTEPERAEALQDLFKGSGGTIQARRFYDLVLKDAQAAQEFVGLVNDMQNASGEFTKAYETMAGTSQNQTQVLTNQWEVLKVEIGSVLLPLLKELIAILMTVLSWWNNLSDGTKKTITWVLLITVAFGALLAVVLAIAGVWAMLAGAAALLGVSVAALIGIAAAVAAALLVLAGVGYLIWKNWDVIKEALVKAWEWVWDRIGPVVIAIRDGLVNAFFWMRDKLAEFWIWFREKFGDRIIGLFVRIRDDVSAAVEAVTGFIRSKWTSVSDWLTKRWDALSNFLAPALELLGKIWNNTWRLLVENFIALWDLVAVVFEEVIGFIIDTFERAWGIIAGVFKTFWLLVSSVIGFFIELIMGMIDIIVGVFTGDWQMAWDGVVRIAKGFWDMLKGLWEALWTFVVDVLGNALGWLGDLLKRGFNIVVQIFKSFWDSVVSGFRWCVDNISALWDMLVDITKKPINFVIEYVYNRGIRWVWNKIADFLGLGQLPEAGMIGAATGASNVGQMSAGRMAKGGVLDGYAPGVDTELMLLSKGEGVLVPEAVRGLGKGFIYWANSYFSNGRAGSDGGRTGRFANGGIVDTVMGLAAGASAEVVSMFKDPVGYIVGKMGGTQWVRQAAGLMKKGADGVVDKAWNWLSSFGGGDAVATGAALPAGTPFGWQAMWAIIKAQFPGATLNSSFRPGDPGYHGKGRAIDIGGPMAAINAWIASTYPNSTQLIYTPGVNLLNGRPFTYDAPTRADHFDHVHWAFDKGGKLPTGFGTYYNGTGVPEAVLTDWQWRAVERAVNYTTGGGAYGDGYVAGGSEGSNIYNVNMTIYTREIDPRQNAIDLGREIGKGV